MTKQGQRPRSLDGVGVLVTRPRLQAAPLCGLLEAQGARVFRFAALDIEPLPDLDARLTAVGPASGFDLIVYASANAVRHGAALLDHSPLPPLAAIGPATARALGAAGHAVSVRPEQGFDSEGLLRQAALAHCAGRRILLVKGEGGRDLLQQELAGRGARLSILEVYRRSPAAPTEADRAALESRFAQRQIQVITATSAELGRNLLALASAALRAHFAAVHWLVPSERVGSALREAGLDAPLLRAASAEDQDLVSELVRWRSSVSGA